MCAKSVQQPEMPEYFYLRPNSRNWQVRLVPPQRLHSVIGKNDYRESTRTADRTKARVIGAQLIADKLREWELLERSLSPEGIAPESIDLSKSLIDEICDRRLASWLKSDEEERYLDGGRTDSEHEDLIAFCELNDQGMRKTLARGPASEYWRHSVDAVFDWCLTLGYDVNHNDVLLPNLVRSFAQTEKLAMEKLTARNNGEDIDTPEPRQTSTTRMSAMSAPYEQHKSQEVGWKTVSKNIHIWGLFTNFLNDALLDEVNSAHVFDFLHSRLHSAEKPWSKGYTNGPARTALKEFFAFARTKKLMTAPNPVLMLETLPTISKRDEKKRKNPRKPFTTEQINKIYQSEWYNPRSKNWTGNMGKDLAARYWPPLIDMLHGFRGVEALQLQAGDFDFTGSVPVITFKIDNDPSEASSTAGDKNTQQLERGYKNEEVFRTLPIHPKLIELGLSDFVNKRLVLGPKTPLFFSSLPKPGGRRPMWGRAYSIAFLIFVRDKLKFGTGYGNHSWRHQFEDRIRKANILNGTWPAGVPELFSGRSLPRNIDRNIFREVSSANLYGDGYEAADLVEFINQLTFSDICFPPNFNTWLTDVED